MKCGNFKVSCKLVHSPSEQSIAHFLYTETRSFTSTGLASAMVTSPVSRKRDNSKSKDSNERESENRVEETVDSNHNHARQKQGTSIELDVQRPGIEPGTSAVLKPRHNQLDHLCCCYGAVVLADTILNCCHC